jgi:two-component system, NtrC family, nitrogen regulation sensor histidine kinase GlnL
LSDHSKPTKSPNTAINPAEHPEYAGLDWLATMVLVVGLRGDIRHVNAAAQDRLLSSVRDLIGTDVSALFEEPQTLSRAMQDVRERRVDTKRFDALFTPLSTARREELPPGGLPVHVFVSRIDSVETATDDGALLIELVEYEQQARLEREERLLGQSQANKELVRNLAHEIKNPLGGIRGAAQLLQMDLQDKQLSEYTEVIINEADRLQSLVDRLLAPHRKPQIVQDVNIHEVLERVRSLISAEFPRGLKLQRDYDLSLPELRGDKEQLIQALLNITHNAALALEPLREAGTAQIRLVTRVSRGHTFGGVRHRLALDLRVVDNGPGIPDDIRDRIFYPLISGREGGSGLGLTLAQTFIHQHDGVIECESRPGYTEFRVLIPLR